MLPTAVSTTLSFPPALVRLQKVDRRLGISEPGKVKGQCSDAIRIFIIKLGSHSIELSAHRATMSLRQ
jgi:hypothetical protein